MIILVTMKEHSWPLKADWLTPAVAGSNPVKVDLRATKHSNLKFTSVKKQEGKIAIKKNYE